MCRNCIVTAFSSRTFTFIFLFFSWNFSSSFTFTFRSIVVVILLIIFVFVNRRSAQIAAFTKYFKHNIFSRIGISMQYKLQKKVYQLNRLTLVIFHWRSQKFWLRGPKWKNFVTLFWWRHFSDVMAMASIKCYIWFFEVRFCHNQLEKLQFGQIT